MQKRPMMCGKPITLTGDPHDLYFQNLPDTGVFDDPVLRLSELIVEADAVCIDVGANIGAHALALAVLAPRGQVHAFEPSPLNVRYLEHNIKLNRASNVVVHASAVGAESGTVEFWHNPDFGAGSVTLDGSDELFQRHLRDKRTPSGQINARSDTDVGGVVIKVPCLTIDAFVSAAHLERIDLIKIDTEGFDLRVLEGAQQVIAAHRPVVFCEFATFALTMHQRILPVDALNRIQSMFDKVYVVQSEAPCLREIATDEEVIEFLYANATAYPVGDLLCAFREHEPLLREIADAPDRPPMPRAVGDSGGAWAGATAQEQRITRLEGELVALRSTLSWKITAPLRALRSAQLRRRG